MACDPKVRSCVLAALYRQPNGQIVVEDGDFNVVARTLQLEDYPRSKIKRAVHSLTWNSRPELRRLERHFSCDGAQIFRLNHRA